MKYMDHKGDYTERIILKMTSVLSEKCTFSKKSETNCNNKDMNRIQNDSHF